MKNSFFYLIAMVLLALASGVAVADDEKMYIGSDCSFADFPLAAHDRMHHRFRNLSGRSQWTTCPITRDSVTEGIEYLSLDVVGTPNYVRLEQRAPGNGSLTGWNASGLNFVGGGRQYYWFSGGSWASPYNRASLALELYMRNRDYVNAYRVVERN